MVIFLGHRRKQAETTCVRSVLNREFQQSRLDGRGEDKIWRCGTFWAKALEQAQSWAREQ